MRRKTLHELLAGAAVLCWALFAYRSYLPHGGGALKYTYDFVRGLVSALGLFDIVLVIWLALITYVAGTRCLDRIAVAYDSAAEKFCFAVSIGLALCSFTVFLLAVTRTLYTPVAYGLLSVATLSFRRELLGIARNGWALVTALRIPPRISAESASRAFLIVYMTVVLGVILVSALGPEIEFDALFNHLEVAKVISETHRLRPIRDIPQTFFPKHTTVLFALGMLLHNEITAKLIHYLFGLLTIVSAYAFARRVLSRTAGLLASAILVSSPIFIWEMRTAHVDCGYAFYVFLSLYAMILWLGTGQRQWLWVGTFLTAWSLGTKYQALFGLGALALMVALETLQRQLGLRKAFARAVKFGLVAAGGLLPWGLVNYFQTGNPVFPFLNGIFKSPYWTVQQTETALMQMADSGIPISLSNWWAIFTIPWRMVADQTDRFHGNIGPFYLILIPLLVFVPRMRREVKLLLIFSILFTTFWSFTGQHTRYYLPVLPALAVVGSYAAVNGLLLLRDRNHHTLGVSAATLLGLMLALNSPYFEPYGVSARYGASIMETLPWKVLTAEETREQYLSKTILDFDAVRYVNERPGHRKILFWWNTAPIAFYVDGETGLIFSHYFDRFSGDDPAELDRVLLENRITHVIIGAQNRDGQLFSDPEKEFVHRYLKKVYEKNATVVYQVSPQPLQQEAVTYDVLQHPAETRIKTGLQEKTLADGDYVTLAMVHDDTRRALVIRASSDVEFETVLADRPLMRFAFAGATPPECSPRDAFQVQIAAGGSKPVLLFSSAARQHFSREPDRWYDNEIDLSGYEQQRVTISLLTHTSTVQGCPPLLWGHPEIVSRPPKVEEDY
ncbi:MAG: glycosyltransferase family 39 protein [Acidobacteria bacterium]|nr:glycosyltransferase family 39 protein [Acidobacteriota bacterium]